LVLRLFPTIEQLHWMENVRPDMEEVLFVQVKPIA
jgi:hypothetical protein